MKKLLLSVLIFFLPISCYSFTNLGSFKGYECEVYELGDAIPPDILKKGLEMYFLAYCNPPLHRGIPLEDLRINESKFNSYEEFIADMFMSDFQGYQNPQLQRWYFQMKEGDQIRGVCIVLKLDTGIYYIDHLGVESDYRRQGIAKYLLENAQKICADFIEFKLDTRVFNTTAQAFYEAMGFKKLKIHPDVNKQLTYYHYMLTKQPESL